MSDSIAGPSACRKIAVAGDISYDFNLYGASSGEASQFSVTLGGAAIIHRLLALCPRPGDVPKVVFASAEPHVVANGAPMAGLWKAEEAGPLFKATRVGSKPARVWRSQQTIGLGQAKDLVDAIRAVELPQAESAADCDLLVLNDDASTFRFGSGYYHWPVAVSDKPKWIVLKMTFPLCAGDLWWTLALNPETVGRLVVVLRAGDLRRHGVRISERVSWERSALDLTGELLHDPLLVQLRQARCVVVTMGSEGALVMSRDEGKPPSFQLIFDPSFMEGEWPGDGVIAGESYGYTAVMTAAVAWGLCCGNADLAMAVERGLAACRLLRAKGHGGEAPAGVTPGMPVTELASVIAWGLPDVSWITGQDVLERSSLGRWGTVEVPHELAKEPAMEHRGLCPRWRILESASDRTLGPDTEPLYGLARRMAVFGPSKGLPNVPVAQFGKLSTVDRDEIEALRNIKRLIQRHNGDKKANKPLSLAVFGPPGAGKSFGVIEIAKQVLGESNPVLTFNLSQFQGPEALIGLFHQVRDKVLEGGLPLVFWDEFDSRDGYWLQYFLAPMQDGKVQEGQITHPLGKCVFVFAGATSYSFEHFKRERDGVAGTDWMNKKGPDFVSRLAGYLNVLGPNQRKKFNEQGQWEDDSTDVCFPVRRAVLLRPWLDLSGKRKDERLDIDGGLLAALLESKEYRHGVRSMERIVRSIAAGPRPLSRAGLPPDEVLGLDVELKDFKPIMHRSRSFEISAEELAPFVHNFYLELSHQEKWKLPYDMPYAELPDPVKGDNIAAARRIPWVLGLAGLYLVRGKEPQEAETVDAVLKANLKMLAEEEHDLWVAFKKLHGWKLGPRDDEKKRHPSLKPYKDLDERDQKKDRDAVLHYPDIAAFAGCRITRTMPRDPDASGCSPQ
jgi:hypothetical protein